MDYTAPQYLLPVFALAAGFASLFFDRRNPRQSWLKYILGGLLIATCGTQIYSAGKASDRAEQTEREKNAEIAWSKQHITALSNLLTDFRAEATSALAGLAVDLRRFGWASGRVDDIAAVERSLEADEQRASLAQQSNSVSRNSVTVQYFPKDVDGPAVYAALEELGFQVTEGHTRVENVATNAIWFSSDVRVDDVKLVALTLVRAGVGIQIIRPFQDDRGRRNLIQVGADAGVSGPNLTVREIASATEFTR